MSNIIITLSSLKNIDKYEQYEEVKRYIVGNEKYALRVENSFTLKDIETLKTLTNKEIYVLIDHLFHENELEDLKEYLLQLKKLKIDGIIFSDFAVYMLLKEINFNVKLTYSTDTTITSKSFSKLSKELNIEEIELAKELTLKEIKNIAEEKQSGIVMFIHGHIYMYNSYRELVSNYFDKIGYEGEINKDMYLYDQERDLYYPIVENKKGTNILSSHDQYSFTNFYDILNSNIDLYKIDGFKYKEDDLLLILDMYVNMIREYNELVKNNIECETIKKQL